MPSVIHQTGCSISSVAPPQGTIDIPCLGEVPSVPAQTTSGGELPRVCVNGLEPNEQQLFFNSGKDQKSDAEECSHSTGAKVVPLLEDPASPATAREIAMEKRDPFTPNACQEVVKVRAEVDKLCVKVSQLDGNVRAGTPVAERECILLTESLMMQLLRLDAIEAEGEAKLQRRIEVRRVQGLMEALDKSLKEIRRSIAIRNGNIPEAASHKWEPDAFESAEAVLGSIKPPNTQQSNLTKVTLEWELFD